MEKKKSKKVAVGKKLAGLFEKLSDEKAMCLEFYINGFADDKKIENSMKE